MTVVIQDKIEREMLIPVARERVWTAITRPEEVASWFGNRVEIDLQPGGAIEFGFDGMVARARVEVVEPPRRFAYRWVPGGGNDTDHSIPFEEMPTTLVMFELDETPQGTKLTLTETGFASLPESFRARALEDNSGGWTEELGHLVDYLIA